MFSCEFGKISKKTFFYRTPLDDCFFDKSSLHEGYMATAQKMKFSIKDFFNKCDQIRSFLRISSHLLKKS